MPLSIEVRLQNYDYSVTQIRNTHTKDIILNHSITCCFIHHYLTPNFFKYCDTILMFVEFIYCCINIHHIICYDRQRYYFPERRGDCIPISPEFSIFKKQITDRPSDPILQEIGLSRSAHAYIINPIIYFLNVYFICVN